VSGHQENPPGCGFFWHPKNRLLHWTTSSN
jgi:hypothetical protein